MIITKHSRLHGGRLFVELDAMSCGENPFGMNEAASAEAVVLATIRDLLHQAGLEWKGSQRRLDRFSETLYYVLLIMKASRTAAIFKGIVNKIIICSARKP